MTETNTETHIAFDMAELEREVQESYLPANLMLTDRCDGCDSQALHAFVVLTDDGYRVLLMCNHHGLVMHRASVDTVHRDYRMTEAEAAEINKANKDKAEKSQGFGEVYREYPRYLTQWDKELWA